MTKAEQHKKTTHTHDTRTLKACRRRKIAQHDLIRAARQKKCRYTYKPDNHSILSSSSSLFLFSCRRRRRRRCYRLSIANAISMFPFITLVGVFCQWICVFVFFSIFLRTEMFSILFYVSTFHVCASVRVWVRLKCSAYPISHYCY